MYIGQFAFTAYLDKKEFGVVVRISFLIIFVNLSVQQDKKHYLQNRIYNFKITVLYIPVNV